MRPTRRPLAQRLLSWRRRSASAGDGAVRRRAGAGRCEAPVPSDPMRFDRLLARSLRADVATNEDANRTDDLMRRLGYQRLDASGTRHRRLARVARRAASWAFTIAIVGAGIMLHNQLPKRMVPVETTVPAAIQQRLERSGEQFHGFIRAIENLRRPEAGEIQAAPAVEFTPHDDKPAAAPFRVA